LGLLRRRGRKVVFGGTITSWGNKQLFMACVLTKDVFSSNMVACQSYVPGAYCLVIKKEKVQFC